MDVVLRDAGEVTVTAHGPTAEDLAVTSGAGHPVLVGWTGDRDLRTAIADVDGRAVFLGVCGDHATDHLDRVAEGAQGGTFALVEEWVDEGADSTLGRILRPPGPERADRALTGGDLDGRTASMIPSSLVIDAPAAWADPELTIATRVPAGWNDGVPLDVAAQPGSSRLAGYAVAGDELEVVVSGDGGDGGGTLVVGSAQLVPPAGWEPGSPLLVTVSISGPPAEAALPDLPTGMELPLGATVTLDVRA